MLKAQSLYFGCLQHAHHNVAYTSLPATHYLHIIEFGHIFSRCRRSTPACCPKFLVHCNNSNTNNSSIIMLQVARMPNARTRLMNDFGVGCLTAQRPICCLTLLKGTYVFFCLLLWRCALMSSNRIS